MVLEEKDRAVRIRWWRGGALVKPSSFQLLCFLSLSLSLPSPSLSETLGQKWEKGEGRGKGRNGGEKGRERMEGRGGCGFFKTLASWDLGVGFF